MVAEHYLPLIVLVGPTAVGKTGLAIEIAQALNGEIVGADSRQIYRQMDIGTAKPTLEQQALIPHHLIDIVDPDQTLSLAEYLELAAMAVTSIHEKGKIPLLVGGTGQYITAFMEGWSVPRVAPNPELRTELEAFAAEHGAAALGEKLKAADPAAYETIDYRNVRRVIRALEVIDATGKPFSLQQVKTPPPYRIFHFGMTMQREILYQRADQRVDEMIRTGFLDEVRGLLEKGYSPSLPSMSGLGYSEMAAHLLNGTPLDATVTAIYSATHDFIRRQYTWFRKYNANAQWLDALDLDREGLIREIRERLNSEK